MQRGLITLTTPEINLLVEILKNSESTVLFQNKLHAALEGTAPENTIEVSAEELESTLDQFALPANSNREIHHLRQKISQKLYEFRS